MDLTKDSEKLLCILYKNYLEKRKAGVPKSTAKSFGSSHDIHESLCPNWIFEDVDDTCRELSRSGMLNCFWADNIAYHVNLSDFAISYMDNRFKNNLKDVLNFLTNLF